MLTLGSGVVRIAFGATCPIMLRPPSRFTPIFLVLKPKSLELTEVKIGPQSVRVAEETEALGDDFSEARWRVLEGMRCFRFPPRARVDAGVDITVYVKNASTTSSVDAIVMVQGTGRSTP